MENPKLIIPFPIHDHWIAKIDFEQTLICSSLVHILIKRHSPDSLKRVKGVRSEAHSRGFTRSFEGWFTTSIEKRHGHDPVTIARNVIGRLEARTLPRVWRASDDIWMDCNWIVSEICWDHRCKSSFGYSLIQT